MWPRRTFYKTPRGARPAPITDADRALIAQAMAAGKVTVCPVATALPRHGTLFGTKGEALEPQEVADLLRVERSA